jgi:hypothetical protein
MPLVTREQALQNIERFQNDVCEFQNNPDLTLKSKNNKIGACQKKILRWEKYVKDMNDCGENTFFFGHRMSKQQAFINGIQGGRPAIYSPEEVKDRVREQQRVYSQNYRIRLKNLKKKT